MIKQYNLKFRFGICLTILTLALSFNMKAQLTGTKNIPGDYATLALAITDLNTVGVGAGGVILNLVSGTSETAPVGGYSITASGTAANQILIQGNGNTITAPTPQTSGLLNDAIFKIIGGDYITVSGFSMQENAANTTTTAASNNMTEFGVALFYATATDGAQNISIVSNTITLNRTYQNTFGIYANSTHNATAVTTASTATGALGGTSNLKIYSNNISNINNGIVVVGPTAAADQNQGLDIGGSSSAQGNVISNFGTTGTFSGYSNVSATVNGIQIRNTGNFNIAYNSLISSVGGTTAGTLNGILINTYSASPLVGNIQSISNNTLSLRSGIATGAINGINATGTTANASTTLTVNNNDFNTCGHTIVASGAIIFIVNTSVINTLNVIGNTFSNLTVNTTGSVTFIKNDVAMATAGVQNVNNNSIVGSFSKTGVGGTVQVYLASTSPSSPTGSTHNATGNNFSNINVTGGTTLIGWSNLEGAPGPAKLITGNTFTNWTGGSSAITAIATNWSGANSIISNNLISTITGSAAITGVSIGTSNGGSLQAVSNNTITSLASSGTGGAVVGITGGSGSITTYNINDNKINTLSSTGTAASVSGLILSAGTTANVFRNKVYNISSSNASGIAVGITISGGTTNNVNNNIIGDLRSTAANLANGVIGINVTGGTTDNIYYNTVLLNAASSGALFGSSAIYASSTPALDVRNNILVNNSSFYRYWYCRCL